MSVLKILASYDFSDRIWIFLELMDGDLTSFIEQNHKTYSESAVKYILKKIENTKKTKYYIFENKL